VSTTATPAQRDTAHDHVWERVQDAAAILRGIVEESLSPMNEERLSSVSRQI
jgi:hypothetical protein